MEDTGSPPEEVIDMLDPALEAAYESAWADWRDSGEAEVWEPATRDGIDAPR